MVTLAPDTLDQPGKLTDETRQPTATRSPEL